jgi:phosphate transport system substrate-binding protein
MIAHTVKIVGLFALVVFLGIIALFVLSVALSGLMPGALLPALPGIPMDMAVSCFIIVVIYLASMIAIGRRMPLPQKAVERFFPFFLPLIILAPVYLWRLLWHGAPLPLGEFGLVEFMGYCGIATAILLFMALGFTLGERLAGKAKPLCWKRFWVLPGALAVAGILIFGLDAVYAAHALRSGGPGEQVTEEIHLYEYAPFAENNQTSKADFAPTLAIHSGYPRLDGATAAYPFYSAVAETVYRGLNEETAAEYVECSRTAGAFDRLISGEADVIFGVQPSPEQQEAAKAAGVSLVPVKIAREAFVFFNHMANPVTGLSIDQIQKIYTKELTDWGELGSLRGEILPYQRPENSGSQTIMENVVMEGIEMAQPLEEEELNLMDGMIRSVASYRGYAGALGYSFRYYATVMNPSERLRILAIEGDEPTIENIRTGRYPFTVDVYACTTESALKKQHVKDLMDWLVSEEGQRLIVLSGYVSLQ